MSRTIGVQATRPQRAFRVRYTTDVYASSFAEAAQHIDAKFKDGTSHHQFEVTDLNAQRTWDVDAELGRLTDGRKAAQ